MFAVYKLHSERNAYGIHPTFQANPSTSLCTTWTTDYESHSTVKVSCALELSIKSNLTEYNLNKFLLNKLSCKTRATLLLAQKSRQDITIEFLVNNLRIPLRGKKGMCF